MNPSPDPVQPTLIPTIDRRRLLTGGLALGALGVLAACSSSPKKKNTADAVGTETWDQILAAAKTEGAIALGVHSGPGYTKWEQFATERASTLFGLKLTASPLSASKFVAQVLAEQAVGKYNWDIHIGPGGEIYASLVLGNHLQPLPSLLAKLPTTDRADDLWIGGFEMFSENQQKASFVHDVAIKKTSYVNRSLVDASKLTGPNDLTQLLDPAFKNKIIVQDPRAGGNSANELEWFLGDDQKAQYGEDFLRKLLAQVVVTADRETMARDFVQGRYPVVIGIDADLLAQYQAQGLGKTAELLPLFEAGDRTISVLKNAPHPNATLVFLNWLFSHEAQDAWANLSDIAAGTRRKDVKVYHPDSRPDYTNLVAYQPILGFPEGRDVSAKVVEISKDVIGA